MTSSLKPATPTIVEQQAAIRARLPFHDTRDFEDARRGLIAPIDGAVLAEDGRVVWDNSTYDFLQGDCPDAVNPSLWRQSQLVAAGGLFEVVPGIYQVRGSDLSNITFVEGDAGVVVIDPLISVETAAAALALYRTHRGDRAVTGVIYSHSHIDHFGGVKGVTTQEDVDAGRVPVLAPEGFIEHAIAENVYAGTAMGRRAGYMYGAALVRGPARRRRRRTRADARRPGASRSSRPPSRSPRPGRRRPSTGYGSSSRWPPTPRRPRRCSSTSPTTRALCTAEDATHNLHNLLTLRGAVVRDPHGWSQYLTETIDLFGGDLEVVIASHHWPTWGRERAVEFLGLQRDLYAYLHDQTLRMLNQGLTGPEIAERIELPPALENAWSTRGYYGSVSHNVKAIYQRYLGWFDGNPAHLWEHVPVERAKRYVELAGGIDAIVAAAQVAFDAGDYRWAAEIANHAVFAQPDHAGAREVLADTYEQLGYGAENGTWRDFFLSGATELRSGQFGTPTATAAVDLLAELTPAMLFDALAIQVNGPAAWDERLSIDVVLTDSDERYRVRLANGVLTYSARPQRGDADATVTTTRRALPALATGALAQTGIEVSGEESAIGRLLAVLAPGDPDFAIVTP